MVTQHGEIENTVISNNFSIPCYESDTVSR